MFRTPTLNLILGLGLCSLGGAMLYIYFKSKDDEDDLDVIDGKLAAKKKREISLQLTVHNEIVPALVGRSGANLKIVEEKTGTVIKFREKDDNHQCCEIRGLRANVDKAKNMLLKEIERSPTVKEEIFVPQSACGKIIGRCGESLQEICRKSLSKVSVDSGDRSSGNTTRRVVITGNRSQVNIAKKLIEEKVKEDEISRRSIEESEQKREPRRSPTNSISSTHSSIVSVSSSYLPPREKLILSDTEKPMEVYVSAVASPAKFWLQLVGPQSRKLDELVENMTEYYNDKDNQGLHKIADPYLGQIVAALFKYDGKWYRAEIVGILPNEYNPRDVVLDLYFVDYGDSEYIAPDEVFELRTDFLTLRFQAIECYLAHVKPALTINDPDIWDQQAITKFEEITHVASWKKLVSRVITYKERPKGGNHIRREGSPVPGVELFDTSDGNEINIAHILISQGYAIPDYPNSETNNVLRLGGGDFTNNLNHNTTSATFASLPEASSSNGNISADSTTNIDEHLSNNSPLKNGGDLSLSSNHSNQQFDDNRHHNSDFADNAKKINSDEFLKREKQHNGNVIQDKSTLLKNHNHLNRLIQS